MVGIKISEIVQRLTDIVNETNVEVSEKIGDTSVTKKFDLKKLQDQIDGKASAAILQDAIAQIDTLTNQVEDKVDGPETSVIGNLPVFGSEDGKTITDSGTSIADIVSQIGGGSGDVTGPEGAGDGNIAVFDGYTGKAIRDSYINQQNVVQGSGYSVDGHVPVFGGGLGNYIYDSGYSVYDLLGGAGGGVVGPAGSTPGNFASFADDTGQSLADSGINATDIGDVKGPESASVGNIVVFNSESGKVISDSGYTITDLLAGEGGVVGPESAIAGNLPLFADDTGKVLLDSGIGIDDIIGQTPVESMVTITVGPEGSGADFFTLGSAIDHAIKNYRPAKAANGPFVKIFIMDGFLTYESIIIDGLDLSWIGLENYVVNQILVGSSSPLLKIVNGGAIRILDCRFTSQTAGQAGPCFEVSSFGKLLVTNRLSIAGFNTPIKVNKNGFVYGNSVFAEGTFEIVGGSVYLETAGSSNLSIDSGVFVCNFCDNTNALLKSIMSENSKIIINDITFDNPYEEALLKLSGGVTNIKKCTVQQGRSVISANKGAIVCISNALEVGTTTGTIIEASNGSVVNIGSTTYDGANYTYGRLWLKGAINNVIDCKCNSTVNINGRLQIDNGVNGFLVSCTNQSKVNIQNIVPEGLGADAAIGNNIGTSGAIICSERSSVNIPSVDLSGTSGIGIDCNNFSVVNARNARLSGYTTAIKSAYGSIVNIPGVVIIDKEGCVLETAISCFNNSSVRAPGAVIRDATINAILCSDSSIVHAPDAAFQDIAGQLALCENGSALNIKNTVATSNVTSGIVSKTGSNVYASGANISTANTVDLSVEQGGFIFAHGAIADLSKAVNTMGADGIIWGDEPAP